jgi:GYF domain 2
MDAIDRQLVDQWHLARNGKQYGPYRFSTLVEAVKRSVLYKDDQVWRPGWESWQPAHSVPELFVPPDGRRGLQTPRVDAHAVHAPANTGAQNTASKPAKGLTGFFKRLAQYYAEFLSTDFKKQRLPRRRLENADALGRLVGIPLRKYPGFQQKLWGELAKPIGTGLSVIVSRGSWRAVLPKAVVETTATYIAQVTQKDVDAVVNGVMKNTLALAERLRRKTDRIDPTRVRRPCGCLGRSAFTPDSDEVCRLL